MIAHIKRMLSMIQDVQAVILLGAVYWIFASIASVWYRALGMRSQGGWTPWKNNQDTLEDVKQQF